MRVHVYPLTCALFSLQGHTRFESPTGHVDHLVRHSILACLPGQSWELAICMNSMYAISHAQAIVVWAKHAIAICPDLGRASPQAENYVGN